MHDQVSAKGVCSRIADHLAQRVGRSRFERYFKGCEAWELRDGLLRVAAPTPFYASWLESRFGEVLREAATAEAGPVTPRIEWFVGPLRADERDGPALSGDVWPHDAAPRGVESPAEAKPVVAGGCRERAPGADAPRPAGPRPGAPPTGRPAQRRRRTGDAPTPRASLDDFVVGPSNRLAYSAARRLADPGSDPGFQLLVMHGECGVGKTHLLQGVARAFGESRPGSRIRWLSGETFTNEYVTAVRSGGLEAFRQSMRRLDLLCIDDVHFVARKTATQSELLHTFDALDLTGARVALVSDEHPRELADLNRRLVSRFLAGMVVRIDTPDHATRLELVERLASRRGLRLDRAARALLAERCAGSVRDILGALARVDAVAQHMPGLTTDGTVGAAVVSHAIGGTPAPRPGRPVRMPAVVDTVCQALSVDPSDVLGRSRHRRVVLARSLVAYLARRVTTHSFPEIAQAMNRPNHSTVVTACQRIERQVLAGAECAEAPGGSVPLADLCERLRLALVARNGVAAA